jgi:hypothetical protein
VAYGVKANVKAPHKFLRMGGLCWMLLLNPGWGGEKVMVRGVSRGGRKVDTWVDSRDLTNFRAGWVPDNGWDKQQSPPMPFDSREAAQAWADGMNECFGSQPVREHAAKFGRDEQA